MWYIISLKHSRKVDKYITLWRPHNAGYCYSKGQAGCYPVYDKGYHDTHTGLPISKQIADQLFELHPWVIDVGNTEQRLMIENTKANRDKLGLCVHKGRLKRKDENIRFLNELIDNDT